MNNVRISGCIGKHAQSILDCYLRSGVHKNEQIDIFHERETIKCIFQRTRCVSAIIVGTVDHHFRIIRANGFFNFFNARRLLYLAQYLKLHRREYL